MLVRNMNGDPGLTFTKSEQHVTGYDCGPKCDACDGTLHTGILQKIWPHTVTVSKVLSPAFPSRFPRFSPAFPASFLIFVEHCTIFVAQRDPSGLIFDKTLSLFRRKAESVRAPVVGTRLWALVRSTQICFRSRFVARACEREMRDRGEYDRDYRADSGLRELCRLDRQKHEGEIAPAESPVTAIFVIPRSSSPR